MAADTRSNRQFETGPLSDEPDTATYSSQHFKALGRPETFDVAIRLWRLEPAKAQERYEELLTQLPREVLERAEHESVLGRVADPEDISRVILFLCTEAARHITGQVIVVDGGLTLA